MGFQTQKHVTPNRRYDVARRLYEATAPIRGRVPEIRPLARRSDVDLYSIRMDGDTVEYVLHNSPVVKFRPNGDIAVNLHGYNTVSTRAFIAHTLNVGCTSSRGQPIISLPRGSEEGERSLMPTSRELVLRLGEDGRLYFANGPMKVMGYRLNRQNANTVRARYKGFLDYMRGFITLRKTEAPLGRGAWRISGRYCVPVSPSELAEHLGVMQINDKGTAQIDTRMWKMLVPSSWWSQMQEGLIRKGYTHESATKQYMELIEGGDEETQHKRFYKAALVLLSFDKTIYTHNEGEPLVDPVYEQFDGIMSTLDEIILRANANEVLDKVELKPGSTANPKYERWMEGEKA